MERQGEEGGETEGGGWRDKGEEGGEIGGGGWRDRGRRVER